MIVRPIIVAAAGSVVLAFSPLANGKTRAECERDYTPQRAQEGKDVIWAPTEDAMVVRMLDMAKVTAADKVYDLGAGDGKIVIAAAKEFGATGVGIEYDPDLVRHARCLAAAEGVDGRVTFIEGDIFESDFRDATVVALYLTPQVNGRLLPSLLELKPGTRIVAYSFGIGDWPPDEQIDSFGDGSAFLFVVPANVSGRWTFRSASGDSFAVELEQSYQNLHGTARGAAATGKLAGNQLELTYNEAGTEVHVTGAVRSERIIATLARDGSTAEYVGTRD
jgi:SAM-dependent methyltransferase